MPIKSRFDEYANQPSMLELSLVNLNALRNLHKFLCVDIYLSQRIQRLLIRFGGEKDADDPLGDFLLTGAQHNVLLEIGEAELGEDLELLAH